MRERWAKVKEEERLCSGGKGSCGEHAVYISPKGTYAYCEGCLLSLEQSYREGAQRGAETYKALVQVHRQRKNNRARPQWPLKETPKEILARLIKDGVLQPNSSSNTVFLERDISE